MSFTEIVHGISRPPGDKMSVAELSEKFISQMSDRVQRDAVVPEYLRNVKGHFRNYISRPAGWTVYSLGGAVRDFKGAIGHVRLRSLRPAVVEQFRDDLLATGLNHKTVRAILTSLHLALEYAMRMDFVEFNAANKIKIEIPRNARSLRRTPPPAEAVMNALAILPPNVRFFIELVASTGVRTGELRALRFRHVDMEKKTLLIECSASATGVVGPPKSSAGYRKIPLSDALIERISAFRATASATEDDFIMSNAKGGICQSSWLLKQLYLAFDAFDWPKDKRTQLRDQRRFNIHELRPYAISSWIAADLGVKAIQTYAGYADKMPWNRDAHLFLDKRHAEKMNVAARAVFGPL